MNLSTKGAEAKWEKKYNINSVLIPYTKDSLYLRTKYKRPSNKIFRRQNIFSTLGQKMIS